MVTTPDLTIFGSIVILVVIEISRMSRQIELHKFPDVIEGDFMIEWILHRFVWYHFLNTMFLFFTIYILLVFDTQVNRMMSAFLFAVWVAFPVFEVDEYYMVLESGEFPDSLAYHLVLTALIHAAMVLFWINTELPVDRFWAINIMGWIVAWGHSANFLFFLRKDFENIDHPIESVRRIA